MSLNDMTNEEIIRLAAKAGADAALKRMSEEKQKNKQMRKKHTYHNTKLLLENYRAFKAHSENAVSSAEEAMSSVEQANSMDDILNLMWDPNGRSDMIIESIKNSAVRTRILMTHIDSMFRIYEQMCMSSKRVEDRRRYDVLYDKYISAEEMTIAEIAKKYFIDIRTVYGDLKAATEKLSQLLFGIDWN